MSSADYNDARWYGAHKNNYTEANRPDSNEIDKVIVHVTQGSWSGTINWFKNEDAYVSAHYTIRSDDGFIGQSVHEKDIAYHAGNWNYNQTSFGIEHEGYVDEPEWFTPEMYRSSARLVAYLCEEYDIPVDRQHILGHDEVPESDHTDPGKHWDWPRYMDLVRKYSRHVQIVNNASEKRFAASSNWKTSDYNDQRYGKDYRYIEPGDKWDNARFKIRTPSRGSYRVQAWWPASDGYNGRAVFRIMTTDGWKRRAVDQREDGGRWVSLGVHELDKGDDWRVQVSNRSSGSGYIVADAIRIVEQV